MISQRRLSRELALQVLFQQEFAKAEAWVSMLNNFRESFANDAEVWAYAQELIEGVGKRSAEIDALIEKHSSHWTLPRMAMVDRNIMRVAVYEAKFAAELIPPAVVIDEAVEISKKFGTSDSPAFVNGILDQIVKQ